MSYTPETQKRLHGLVLERKVEETVVIEHPDGPIEITVIRSGGTRLKLLFQTENPKIPIYRKELGALKKRL